MTTTADNFAAAAISASETVAHLNALPGIKAEIISAGVGGNDGAILPGISVNVSIVIEYGGIWCEPKTITNVPITTDIIQQIAHAGSNGCVRLEELIVDRCNDDNVQAVKDLLEAVPAAPMRRIVIKNMFEAGDDVASTLARFTALNHVDLDNCRQMTNAGLRVGLTPSASTIETLNLQSTKLDDDGLEILSGMSNLRDLNLSYTSIKSGHGLQHLQKLPNLEYFTWYAHGNSGQTNMISLEALKGGFNSLKTFKFGANNISNEHVECIATCPTLETLIFSTCGSTDLTDDGMKPLGENLTNLKILSLNGSFLLGDAGIAHLAPLKKLEYLDLGRTKTSSVSVQTTFMEMPRLKVLELYQSNAARRSDLLDKLQKGNPTLNIIVDYMMDGTKSQCAIVYGKQESGFDFGDYDIY